MSHSGEPTEPQHNYTPPDSNGWSEREIRQKIALYGRSQVVHMHAHGEVCNEECKVYLTVEDMPQAWSTFSL